MVISHSKLHGEARVWESEREREERRGALKSKNFKGPLLCCCWEGFWIRFLFFLSLSLSLFFVFFFFFFKFYYLYLLFSFHCVNKKKGGIGRRGKSIANQNNVSDTTWLSSCKPVRLFFLDRTTLLLRDNTIINYFFLSSQFTKLPFLFSLSLNFFFFFF